MALSSRSVGRTTDAIDPESLSPLSTAADTRPSRSGGTGSLRIALLVVGWYVTAIVCVTSSKQVLLSAPFPLLLCLAQFAVSAGLTHLLLLIGGAACFKDSNKKDAEMIKDRFKESSLSNQLLLRRLVTATALAYCAGFVCTNLSFSLASASFTETIKAGEPISSVFLGFVVLRQTCSAIRLCCLVVICVGVGMSCVGADHFSTRGFLLAVASNFCFSYRAVLAKKLCLLYPGELDELTFFCRISTTGFLLLLPLTAAWEAADIHSFLTRSPLSGWGQRDEWATHSAGSLLLLLLVNGTAYCAYNVLSFCVLSRTDIIVHAVLNVCRRVVIVVFTACYFSVLVSPLNACGVALAMCGVLLFSLRSN